MPKLKTGNLVIKSVRRRNVPMCEWVNGLGETEQSEVFHGQTIRSVRYSIVWSARDLAPRLILSSEVIRRWTADFDVSVVS